LPTTADRVQISDEISPESVQANSPMPLPAELTLNAYFCRPSGTLKDEKKV
jgi:hypothetical protein